VKRERHERYPPQRHKRARIVPTARPGPRAPLGWSLSSFARDDLNAQLRYPANLCQIALVRSWFGSVPSPGATRCITGFAVREPNSPDATAPADSMRQQTGPIDTSYHGVANVVLKVSTCASPLPPNCRLTTDASGRFSLPVVAGQRVTVSAAWGQAKASLQIPDTQVAVDTTFNLLIDGGQARS
jgi:hypothetical protein